MKKYIPLILATLLVISLLPMLIAEESADYSFDYSILSAGGGAGGSMDYDIVDTVKLTGLEDAPQGSADYSVAPVQEVIDDTSGVDDWMLY